MKTKLALSFVMVLYAALAAFGVEVSSAVKKPVIKIGVIAPLFGDESEYGESLRNAILMAIREVPASSKFDYKMILEDDGTVASRMALAAKKLVTIDKVDLLITPYGQHTAPVVPMSEQYGVPLISFGTWRTNFLKNQSHTFIMGAVMQPEVDLFIKTCKALGYKRLGYIGWLTPDGVCMTEYLRKRLPAEGIEIVTDEEYTNELKDFRTTLLKINEKPIDSLLVIAFIPQMPIILRQWHIMGDPKPLLTIEGFDGMGDEPLTENHWYPCIAPAPADWAAKYKILYKADPMYGANYAYDGLKLAMRECESFTGSQKPGREWITQALKNAKPFVAAGGEWVMHPDGVMSAPVELYRMEKNKPVPTTVEELVKLQSEKKLYKK